MAEDLGEKVKDLEQQLAVALTMLNSKTAVLNSKIEANNKLIAENTDLKARLLLHEDSVEWKAKRTADLTKIKADADKASADAQKELDKLGG